MAILAFCGDEWDSLDDSSGPKVKKTEQTLETRIHLALKRYLAILDANHGIREKNLLKMLVPLGIAKADLDTTWLATMDSMGSSRGAAAHTSGNSIAVNPADEAIAVDNALEGIKVLDRLLTKLL